LPSGTAQWVSVDQHDRATRAVVFIVEIYVAGVFFSDCNVWHTLAPLLLFAHRSGLRLASDRVDVRQRSLIFSTPHPTKVKPLGPIDRFVADGSQAKKSAPADTFHSPRSDAPPLW